MRIRDHFTNLFLVPTAFALLMLLGLAWQATCLWRWLRERR